jgi:hypothetical protein
MRRPDHFPVTLPVCRQKKRHVIDITNTFISTLVGKNLGKIEFGGGKGDKSYQKDRKRVSPVWLTPFFVYGSNS